MSAGASPTLLVHALWQRRDGLLLRAWARDPDRARVRLHEWFRTDGLPPPPVPPFLAWVWQRRAAAAQRWWHVYRQELAQPAVRALEQAAADAVTAEIETQRALAAAQQVLAELVARLPAPDRDRLVLDGRRKMLADDPAVRACGEAVLAMLREAPREPLSGPAPAPQAIADAVAALQQAVAAATQAEATASAPGTRRRTRAGRRARRPDAPGRRT